MPPEDHHQEHEKTETDAKTLGRDRGRAVRVERSRERGEERTEHEHRDAVEERRQPERARHDRLVTVGNGLPSYRRALDERGDDHEDRQRDHEELEDPVLGGERGAEERQWANVERLTARAVGEAFPLRHDEYDDVLQPERAHSEVEVLGSLHDHREDERYDETKITAAIGP
jgi:hypothetical protein